MATHIQATERKRKARHMLTQGVGMAEIARRLGVHHSTVYRWIYKQDDGWIVTANARDIVRHAKIKTAMMLTKMGLTQAEIGDYLGVGQSYVSQLLRKDEPRHGHPQVPLLISSTVYLSNGNILPDNSRWIATPYNPDTCMMRRVDDTEIVLQVTYSHLFDNIVIDQERAIVGGVVASDS